MGYFDAQSFKKIRRAGGLLCIFSTLETVCDALPAHEHNFRNAPGAKGDHPGHGTSLLRERSANLAGNTDDTESPHFVVFSREKPFSFSWRVATLGRMGH